MRTITKKLSGFNNYPTQSCAVIRAERYSDLLCQHQLLTIRGQGRSYGDAALSERGTVLLTERLNRFLEFDKEKGILTAESGITLAEILKVIVPAGWFLPVTPGTQYVSLGGCVASDVHGKNHYCDGSLGRHIRRLELIDANGNTKICSAEENAALFWATIGGMGLTGIIGSVSLQLIPITTTQMHVTHFPAKNLENTLETLNTASRDNRYCVAWLDLLANNHHFGRGIVMAAQHATSSKQLRSTQPTPWRVPFLPPQSLLKPSVVRCFNEWYYQQQCKKQQAFVVDYQRYFYPLDKLQNWNFFYGKHGFLQYQCVLPEITAHRSVSRILDMIKTSPYKVFLGVIKRFGEQSGGILSFAMPGYTLALDMPLWDHGLFSLLDKLDAIVAQHGGRVYLAKDARLKPDMFRAMYKDYDQWCVTKKIVDPNHVFISSLSRRLQIGI